MQEKLDYELVKLILDYNPETGVFTNKKNGRVLTANADTGLISVSSKSLGIKFNIKPEKLAWFMMYGTVPSGRKRILHRNLNPKDNRFSNLKVITRKEYKQVMEAYHNLTEYMRIMPHHEDQFSYVLHYKKDGVAMREVILDLIIARRKLRSLQLKNAKVLSKFCVFDE